MVIDSWGCNGSQFINLGDDIMMLDDNKQFSLLSFAIILLIALVFSLLLLIIFSYYYPYKCDTGKPEVIGDYKTTGWGNQCAIQDCVTFNKLNKDFQCVV